MGEGEEALSSEEEDEEVGEEREEAGKRRRKVPQELRKALPDYAKWLEALARTEELVDPNDPKRLWEYVFSPLPSLTHHNS